MVIDDGAPRAAGRLALDEGAWCQASEDVDEQVVGEAHAVSAVFGVHRGRWLPSFTAGCRIGDRNRPDLKRLIVSNQNLDSIDRPKQRSWLEDRAIYELAMYICP